MKNTYSTNRQIFGSETLLFTEDSQSQRATRFNTIFVNYDYKTGHYLGH